MQNAGGLLIMRVKPQDLLKLPTRLLQVALLEQSHTQIEMGHRVARPKPKALLKLTPGLPNLPGQSQLLAQQVMGADSVVAEQLRIPEGAEIFVLRRLRLADGETMGIQTAHVPLALAPGLVREDFNSASLYDTLQRKFGLIPFHARETHSAILIEGEDAAILRLPEGSSGLAAKRLTFLADGRPFEFVTSVMRGDRYEIVLDLVGSR